MEARQKLRSIRKEEKTTIESTNEKVENGSEDSTDVKVSVEDSKLFDKKISIFGQKKVSENVPDIFGSKKSVNLFNLPQSNSTNIFEMAASSQPSVRDQEDDDNQSAENGSDKSLQAPPEPTERVMKYEYEERMEKLGEFKLVKFKNGQGPVK